MIWRLQFYESSKKPKRPGTAYIIFLKELAEKQNRKYSDVFKESKGMWQQLPPKEQQRYKDLYMEALKRYNTDLEAWKERMIKEGNEQLVDLKLMHRSTTITPIAREAKSNAPKKERKASKKTEGQKSKDVKLDNSE